MLTARQKELLRSLPRDDEFDYPVGVGNPAHWLEHKRMIRFVRWHGGTTLPIWKLTPAGQAERDKLQETEGEG